MKKGYLVLLCVLLLVNGCTTASVDNTAQIEQHRLLLEQNRQKVMRIQSEQKERQDLQQQKLEQTEQTRVLNFQAQDEQAKEEERLRQEAIELERQRQEEQAKIAEEKRKQQEQTDMLKRLAPSTQMSKKELYADNKDYSSVKSYPEKGTYSIQIDLTNNIMKVYDKDKNVVRMMLCTPGLKDTPTPRGTFKLGSGRRRFGYFEQFDCYAQYWSQIKEGIYIHSVLYEEKDASTIISSSLRNLGRASSHGCVRLTVPDAKWIFENVAPGSKCEVVKLEKDPTLKSMLKLKL